MPFSVFLKKQSPVYIEQELLSISRDAQPRHDLDQSIQEEDDQLLLSFLQYIEDLLKAKENVEFSQVQHLLGKHPIDVRLRLGPAENDPAEQHGAHHCIVSPVVLRFTNSISSREMLGTCCCPCRCNQLYDCPVQWYAWLRRERSKHELRD